MDFLHGGYEVSTEGTAFYLIYSCYAHGQRFQRYDVRCVTGVNYPNSALNEARSTESLAHELPNPEFMQRKEFIKRGFTLLGMATVLPFLDSCQDDGNGTCAVSPTETAGPFPTKDPASYVLNDIRADRTGVKLTVKVTIKNKNNTCSALSGALVDIWHCDKDGFYSEYGGSGSMQSTDMTALHYLRGRQTTNADGVAGFTSVMPGWYNGRAPHIHVHVFDASGKSLLVTQIAFPTDVCDTIYTTATTFYTKGKQGTANMADNILSDSLARNLGAMTGNITDGYVLEHTVNVAV